MSSFGTISQQTQQASELGLLPPPKLTYREQRRLVQAELRHKFPDHKRRGPTRGLKYASRRVRNHEQRITVTFMDSVRRVVGEKADEFICDCSNWVEDICPLNVLNWAQMNPDKKEQLYSKISGICGDSGCSRRRTYFGLVTLVFEILLLLKPTTLM